MSSEELEILLKVLIAIAMGGLIGVERELSHKPAGIRTHMFVAAAATLVVSVSMTFVDVFNTQVDAFVRADPIRVIEAVIVGISFIGAGTVIKSAKSHHVFYLTTASSILLAASIGITIAIGYYGLAAALTFTIVAINIIVGGMEARYMREKEEGENE